jgi:uncharacterized small protein (DUF1192 family)
MEQLTLLACDRCAALEAQIAKLQRQVERLKATVRQRENAYASVRAERDRLFHLALDDPQHPLQTEWAQLSRDNEKLRAMAHKHFWVVYREKAGGAPPTDRQLKEVIALAHPDKWSAGQDATTLAHEVTVALNKLRNGKT